MTTNIKIYTLAVASLLLQFLTWFLLNSALGSGAKPMPWIVASVVAAAAISVTTFFMLVNRAGWLANTLILVSAAVYLLIFPHNSIVWFGGLVFCLFAFWYEHRLWRETKSRMDFSVTHVMGSSVPILLYGILLLIGFNIYYTVSADFRQNPDKYYNSLGQQAASSVPYFSKIFPDTKNLDQSIGQYFDSQAKQTPGYSQASNFERDIIFNEAKLAFEKQFQITANENQTLAQVMAEVAVNKIKQAVEPYQNYIPLIFAILITGLLYTFSFLIRWLVLLISWVLFRLLLTVGFFRLEKVQVTVDKLSI